MTNQLSLPDLFASEFLIAGGIELFPEQITRAIQQSQSFAHPAQQWQVYLNALALAGCIEWLAERAPELVVTCDRTPLFQLGNPEQIEPLAYLQVGRFTVCLITTEVIIDDFINLPSRIADQSSNAAHLYVLMEVLEEQELVQIYGYLHHHQLMQLHDRTPLQTDSPNTYLLPLSAFHSNPDNLLLDLQYLVPEAIASTPHLFTSPTPPPPINVAAWLRDRLDDVAQELAWVLLPIFTAEPAAIRAGSERFEEILATLATRQIIVPPTARGAYRELIAGDVWLSLYTWVQELPTTANGSEWLLLLVLATPSGDTMPGGIRLEIRDGSELLLERTLTEFDQDSHLYAQLIGSQDEQFEVTIFAPDGSVIDSPTFTFRPNLLP